MSALVNINKFGFDGLMITGAERYKSALSGRWRRPI